MLARKREKAVAVASGEVDDFDVKPGDAGRAIARDPECLGCTVLADANACFARDKGDSPQMMRMRAMNRSGVTMISKAMEQNEEASAQLARY